MRCFVVIRSKFGGSLVALPSGNRFRNKFRRKVKDTTCMKSPAKLCLLSHSKYGRNYSSGPPTARLDQDKVPGVRETVLSQKLHSP